jgi:adenylate cyclase class IV
MTPPPRRNLELKARDLDPARSLQAARALGAEDRGEIWQRDTYFDARRGRLKLREQRPGAVELIDYERPETCAHPPERESRFRVVDVTEPVEGLREALTAQFGVRVVVEKQRRLFVHKGVRIHLDRVEDLGSFIELEAVADPSAESLERERELLAELRAAFSIAPDALVSASYADMVAEQAGEAAAPSVPAASTPAPSTPPPSTPAPSTPAASTPPPSTPPPGTPAPSTPIRPESPRRRLLGWRRGRP